jgi:hypothetical protein
MVFLWIFAAGVDSLDGGTAGCLPDFLLRKTLGSKTACPHAKREGWLANAHCQLVLSTTTPKHVCFLGLCGLLLGFVWVC